MLTVTMFALLTLGLVLVLAAVDAAPTTRTRAFSVHDLLAMRRIGDAQVAPDGERVVFTVRDMDVEANRGASDLWLVHSDGTRLRRLTTHPDGSHSPRWSADGTTVFFLSGRSGSSQVWRIAIDGGEAEPMTAEPLDVGAFTLSRDDTQLAMAMDVFPGSTPKETADRLEQREQQPASGQLYDRLFVRHWDTWKDGRRSHLFVRPVAAAAETPARDVMPDMDADTPWKPFGGTETFTFTPDGQSIVFTARDAGNEEAWSTHFNIYVVPIDGSSPPRVVVEGRGASLDRPTFSPDGRRLAYLATRRPGYEADHYRPTVMDWPGGEPRTISEDWDHSAGPIAWSADGCTIYTSADSLGRRPLFAIDVASGDVTKMLDDVKVTDVATGGGVLIVGVCHHRAPTELHAIRSTDGTSRPITEMNSDRLADVRMGEPEQFTFKGWNDETVHAWVVKPVDFDPSKTYPVAYLIHGGPQGSFGVDFHYRWNPQVYAGAGYAAIAVDFHGSTGYGQAFTDAINGHWGDRPFEDLQKGLAAALERFPWMDGNRVAALGASYGGYMINWIAGQWPDAFRCLVNHDGNLDERMAYYDTEELWFPEWERGGTPWEKPEAYSTHNPIDHVDKWKTPMLVIHGAKDYRVVDTQGLSTFTALQRRGIPSRLLFFPDENHWVLKPANSLQWHETVIEWLDRWTK